MIVSALMVVFMSYLYYSGKLGKGNFYDYNTGFHAIKSKDKKNIYLIDILTRKYDDNHIIAIRVPAKIFYGANECSTFFNKKISYLIINKSTYKIYETNTYEKFKDKLKNLNIKINFDDNDLIKAQKRYNKKKHLYKIDKTLSYLNNNCKEDFKYPIEIY